MQFIFMFLLLSQWGSDTRLTTAPGYSCNGLSLNGVVAGPSNRVHVCWWDDRVGNAEIYYKQSTNGGETWGDDIRLTDTTAADYDPAIVCAGNKVHIIWRCDSIIFYRCSTDEGQAWLPKQRLFKGSVQSPAIAASGDTIYAAWVWRRSSFPPWPVLFRRSLDGGTTWLDTIRVSQTPYDSCKTCALVVDIAKRVHVFWTNMWWWEGYYGVCTRKSTDFGVTWSIPVEIEIPCAIEAQVFSCAAGSDPNVLHYTHIGLYTGGTLYNFKYLRSSDAGETWNQYFFKGAGASWRLWDFPDVVEDTSTGEVHLVWEWNETSAEKGEIMYNHSVDNGLTWGSDERLTYDDSISTRPSINCGSVHLIWSDTRDGNYEIYYKKKIIVGIEEEEIAAQTLKTENGKLEVYPNPFQEKIQIRYMMQDTGCRIQNFSLKIYDASGRLVKDFSHSTHYAPRPAHISWDGVDEKGVRVSEGVYFVVINNGNYYLKRKILLVR